MKDANKVGHKLKLMMYPILIIHRSDRVVPVLKILLLQQTIQYLNGLYQILHEEQERLRLYTWLYIIDAVSRVGLQYLIHYHNHDCSLHLVYHINVY